MLKTLLGDYPVTAALKAGRIASDLPLQFDGVKLPQNAFKRVVRDLEFDLAELAIVTFLLAKAHGKPYRLLPAVITARFQHPYIACKAESTLRPEDLTGRTIGQRSYSVTTATWLRGILADDYGVDVSRIRWITFEEPHVAEFRDPSNVERAPAGKEVKQMLLDGELDAAILGEPPSDPRLRTLIADPQAAAKAWQAKHGAIQINHMVVAKATVDKALSNEFFSLLKRSREAAGSPAMNPFGLEENRRNLEVAVDCVYRQGMIPRRYGVEELFE
jgi:4,5-dihydroxyphthalate decarboxylase